MDAEKLLKAFSPEETQEVAAALPEDVFEAEATHRGFTVPEAAGPLAVEGATTAEVVADPFQISLGEFLAADTPLVAEEQLSTMGELWQRLGLTPPALDNEQLQSVQAKLEAHPDHRVMPVPLLDLDGRKAISERAKTAFAGSKFSSDYEALWTPDESWTYGKLLSDPESTVKDGRKSYGLRYQTRDGVVNRSELVRKLKHGGKAVEGEDGTVWIFPVMDVRVESPREYVQADRLHKAADITQIPETLITTQLLHQANGTPNSEWHIDFTNEGVYELDKKGNPVAPVGVASVRWDPNRRRVYLRDWSADYQDGRFGVRAAESGL